MRRGLEGPGVPAGPGIPLFLVLDYKTLGILAPRAYTGWVLPLPTHPWVHPSPPSLHRTPPFMSPEVNA